MRRLKMQLKRVAAASVGLFIVLVGLSYLDFRRPATVESSLIETSELGWNPEENEIREGPFFPPSNDEPTALPETTTIEIVTTSAAPPNKEKIILYWNHFFNQTDMAFGLGREPFIKAGCEVDSCIATNDRSRFNESDAVIIHWESYKEDDLPSHRFSHQRFIFMIFETLPGGAGLPCFSKPHFYNWTMSYRRDSDIYVGRPYGALRRLEGVQVADQLPAKLKEGERPLAPEQLMTRKYPHLANRTKLIAWFNSHCPTHSQREDYVQRLAQFIPVDIYGKCGPLQCLPRNDPQCDLRVLVNYKFYLAAENSLCPDYVTEKFYRALMNDVVPVVYGGADYAEYAPPNSYIDVADFDSPQDLANYLLLLNQNDALYQKYFAWKKEYQVIRRPLNGFCDLCRKLNDPTTESKSYESVRQWWYEQVPCMPGSTYLESIPPLKTPQPTLLRKDMFFTGLKPFKKLS